MTPIKPETPIEYVTKKQLGEALQASKGNILNEFKRQLDETVSGAMARVLRNMPRLVAEAIAEANPHLTPIDQSVLRGSMHNEFAELMPRKVPDRRV